MTREEAIKCIQEEKLRYERAPWVNGCPMTEEWQKAIDICDMALSALRTRQEQESKPLNEWISVKDRLPEEKVNCIVHYKHDYCNNDGYWAIGFCFYDGEKFRIDLGYKVTHWMQMPEPPKGE